jgi:ribosomal protein L11 methylase PrmA
MNLNRAPGSFRDPSGFVFSHNGTIYRTVGCKYKVHYDHLMESGLYKKLTTEGLLIPHEEITLPLEAVDGFYKILQPSLIPFISYPYEWCFAQLKNAAQAFLRIQKIALDYGMTLKDATSFNLQFYEGHPCLIDTLSFEVYKPGQAWAAYRQFVEHFLAPLALASMQDPLWIQFLRVRHSGIPLRTAHRVLPLRSWWKFGIFFHIHLQTLSIALARKCSLAEKSIGLSFRKESFYGLIESLTRTIKSLHEPRQSTGWQRYYQTSTETEYLAAKKQLTLQFLREVNASTIWDIGANDGTFSRLAATTGAYIISLDSDHACVSNNYKMMRSARLKNILPLWIDLSNPSPNVGWSNNERFSLLDRGPSDLVLALAIIHHLAISNNVPLDNIASFFAKICNSLIIEFIPKTDAHVQELLSTREDIFLQYNKKVFEDAFTGHFTILQRAEVSNSGRIMYLMKKKD